MKRELAVLWICSIILAPFSHSDTLDLTNGTNVNGHVTFDAISFSVRAVQPSGAEAVLHYTRDEVTTVEFNQIFTNPNRPAPRLAQSIKNPDAETAVLDAQDSGKCESLLATAKQAKIWPPPSPSYLKPEAASGSCVDVEGASGKLSARDEGKLSSLASQYKKGDDAALFIYTSGKQSGAGQSVKPIKDYLTSSQGVPAGKITITNLDDYERVDSHKQTWPPQRLCSNCAFVEVISYPPRDNTVPKRAPRPNTSDEVILLHSQAESGILQEITDQNLRLKIGKSSKSFRRSDVKKVSISH